MIVVAIDPGITGALAFLGDCTASVHDLPTLCLPVTERSGKQFVPRRLDGRGLALLIRERVPAGAEAFAVVERVQAMQHGGNERGNSAQSQGSLMRSLGAIEAVLDVLQLPPVLVTPQTWQSFYGLVGKGSEIRGRGEQHAVTKLILQLYPHLEADLRLVRDHNRADATAIGHYALRKLVPTR